MQTLMLEDRQVGYRDQGWGAPVVLVHGSACTSGYWAPVSAALGSGHRVLAPDLHGHGWSDPWSGEGQLTLADEARLVAAVIAQAREPVHLVGHSYGGAVALRAALDRPGSVRSLTLIEPAAFHLLAGEPFAEIQAVAARLTRAVCRGDYAAAMAGFVDYWNGAGTWQRLERPERRELQRFAHAICLHFWAAMTELGTLAAYQRLDMPAVIVQGRLTTRPAARVAGLLARALPFARREIVADAGHRLPATHPEAVAEILRRQFQPAEAIAA